MYTKEYVGADHGNDIYWREDALHSNDFAVLQMFWPRLVFLKASSHGPFVHFL